MALLYQASLPSAPHAVWSTNRPTGPPSEWCSHNQTVSPAMARRGHRHVRRHTGNKPCQSSETSISLASPGRTSGKPRLGNHHAFRDGSWSAAHQSCTTLWDISSLRPSQADCHHIAATIASNSGELGSVASRGLAQGRLESIASCGQVRITLGLC